jgi:Helix-turn-helix domain
MGRPAKKTIETFNRMTNHKSQVDIIAGILEREGRITRNQCLRMYISRLAARVADLEKDGWVFRTKKVGNDYEYRVVERPKARQLSLV